MPTYFERWRTFRSVSDENRVTARHLLSRPRWPRKNNAVIVDVGCGDGELIRQVILDSRHPIGEVRLIDPDPELLNEATKQLRGIEVLGEVSSFCGKGEELAENCYIEADVVLAVHVVYLMSGDGVGSLLEHLPSQVPLYLILDAPGSVFTRLWRRTAPQYARRAEVAHRTATSLDASRFSVAATSVVSHVENPAHLNQPARDAMISLLAYADVRTMPSEEIAWVSETIDEHVVGSQLTCESTCYEIMRA
jgi:SAM-dependent methyltransferase